MNKCQRQGFQKVFTVTAMPVVDTLSSVYVWIARGSQDTSLGIGHWANSFTKENGGPQRESDLPLVTYEFQPEAHGPEM